MISYIIAIVVKTVKDHSIEWLTIATLTPVAYLLFKKRKLNLNERWVTRFFLKHQLKKNEIDKNKFGGRLLLSLLLALGLGLLFGLINLGLGIAIGLGGLLLGLLVVFRPRVKY